MATDQGPVVQSALLRNDLVRLRKESGLTQEQVAEALEWSPSKLIRIEGGRSSITKVDLDALLSEYGVTSESRREQLQALNRGARERAFWNKYRDDVDAIYLNYVGLEAGAAFIRAFESSYVPGLLQTADYAKALTSNWASTVKVASIIGLRLERQAELAKRSAKPRQYYVIDEAVIRRHIGVSTDPAIMPNQLRSLADKAEADELITVRVMPFTVGAHLGLSGPFILLEFDGVLADYLYMDAGRTEYANLVAGDDPRVGQCRDEFETLVERALPADKSIELIRTVAESMS
jgi:transcriptional regulator with XRE-family HTH domain